METNVQQDQRVRLAFWVAGGLVAIGAVAPVVVGGGIHSRIAVVGTCPPAPAHCPVGFEQPMTSGENNGLGVATFCGVLAILTGFYGLLLFYRRQAFVARQQPSLWPAQPPGP